MMLLAETIFIRALSMFDLPSRKEKKNRKPAIIFVSLFLVLAIGLTAGLIFSKTRTESTNSKNPVVAEVGKDKIYLSDFNARLFASTGRGTVQTPNGITEGEKSTILYQLTDMKVLEKELAKRNIVLDDDMLAIKAKEKYKDYDGKDELTQKAYRDYVKLDVAKQKLKEEVVTWKDGNIIFCRFDRADQDDMKNKPDAKDIKEKHKEYAEKYCSDMKARLEQGKTDYNQEMSSVLEDSTLGQNAWKPYVVVFTEQFSKDKFTPNDFQYSYNEYEQIQKLDSSKKGTYQLLIKDINGLESSYAVVSLSGKGKNGETVDFTKWFADKVNENKVRVYKERIKS